MSHTLTLTRRRLKILSLISYILLFWTFTSMRGVAAQQNSLSQTQNQPRATSATSKLTTARTTFTVITETPTFTVVVDGSSTTTKSDGVTTTTAFYSSTLTTETATEIGATRTFWVPVSIATDSAQLVTTYVHVSLDPSTVTVLILTALRYWRQLPLFNPMASQRPWPRA